MSYRIILLTMILVTSHFIIVCMTRSCNVQKQSLSSADSKDILLQQKKAPVDINQQIVDERQIWQGDAAGFKILWTTADLYVQNNSSIKKIWRPLVQQGFDDFIASLKEGEIPGKKMPSNSCEYKREFQVLSIVGSLVSFVDDYSLICERAASPSLDTRFTTIDINKPEDVLYQNGPDATGRDVDLVNPGKIVKLSDYFEEHELLTALLNDPIIKKAISGLDRPVLPRTLSDLPALFAKDDYGLGEIGYELRPDYLTRFAFHHIEGSKVAVRIGLPPHFGFNKAMHLQLGILLEMRPTLRKSLELAEIRKEGFMMKDLPKIANKQMTKFSFRKDIR
jgi:hypothetical protein